MRKLIDRVFKAYSTLKAFMIGCMFKKAKKQKYAFKTYINILY